MPETESPAETLDVDLQHLSSVGLGAVVVAVVAAWVTADILSPLLVGPVVALLTGYLLDDREGDREKVVFVGYVVVALLAVAPLVFVLPDVVSGRTAALSQIMTVVVTRFILFGTILVGYVVYRIAGGTGVIERARDPDRRRSLAGYVVAATLLVLPFLLFLSDLLLATRALGTLSALVWRLLGLVAVAVAYGAYRLDGGQALLERGRTVTEE